MSGERVTQDMIEAELDAASIQFHQFPNTTVTVAAVKLRNGFALVGHSACVSPDLFDAQVGKELALRNARDQLWSLLGFRLRDAL
ncbi:hypothetical protein HC761_00700 [bacterium]|nr:hypothetical protein [bacterium]